MEIWTSRHKFDEWKAALSKHDKKSDKFFKWLDTLFLTKKEVTSEELAGYFDYWAGFNKLNSENEEQREIAEDMSKGSEKLVKEARERSVAKSTTRLAAFSFLSFVIFQLGSFIINNDGVSNINIFLGG